MVAFQQMCFKLFGILVAFLFQITTSYSQEYRITTPLQQKCNKESVAKHDSVINWFYGVAGTGFVGNEEWIGMCEAEYQWGGPWRPVDGYKHTLCGKLFIKKSKNIFRREKNQKYHLISDGDGDMVIYIFPDSSFQSLLSKSLRPRGHHFVDSAIACEVAIKEPGNTIETDAATFFESLNIDSLQFKPIGVYGPWVSDVHHDNSPEIHPVQQMWKVEQKQNDVLEYMLYSFIDNSSRFNNKKNFPDSCFLKPWVTIPLINVFYIPFQISLNGDQLIVYDLSMPSSNNINLYDSTENQLQLFVDGKLRLRVKKSSNLFPHVSLFELCQAEENLIQGYLKIETSIGKANVNSGAHAVLKIMRTKIN